MRIISSYPFMLLIIICIVILIFQDKIYTFVVGKAGEHWAKKELEHLDKNKYTVYHDIMFKVDGKYHQIDHLVVSEYGVFVIETKQYNGYITGGKYDKKWVRRVGEKEYYYTNPIRQNYGHIKSVCELLGLDEKVVFGIVYIPSTAKLKLDNCDEVARADELVDKITIHQEVVLNGVSLICERIERNNIISREARKKHVSNIKNNKVEIDDNMCPKCGGTLVKKDGKYGLFYGCSNYPKCHYIKKISK